jgi:hypothetical protein
MSPATRTPLHPASITPLPSSAVPVALPRVSSRPQLDTLALAPASALPRQPLWRALAHQLPKGSVLIVLPRRAIPGAAPFAAIIAAFQAHGHPVTTIPMDALREQQRPLL